MDSVMLLWTSVMLEHLYYTSVTNYTSVRHCRIALRAVALHKVLQCLVGDKKVLVGDKNTGRTCGAKRRPLPLTIDRIPITRASVLLEASRNPHGFNVISSYLARFELTRLRDALCHYTKCYRGVERSAAQHSAALRRAQRVQRSTERREHSAA